MSSGSERGQAGQGPKRPAQDQQSRAAGGQPERHVREGRWPAEGERGPGRHGEPDVLLDVPELRVGELRLAVDGLDADLSLRARLANLLVLDAGVRVRLNAVELDINDVRAEVLLKVRLERLVQILDRALDTLDQNPQLIESIKNSAHAALDDAGRAAQQVTGRAEHLDRVVDRLGRDIGSISARAEWTGEGTVAKEVSEPRRAERQGGERMGEGGQRPPGPPAGGEARGQQPGGGVPGGERGAGKAPREPEGGRGGPGEGHADGAGWPVPGDLAEQAGEALRQVGRSVWDAIRAGMAQHGPESKS
ncbi:hypothetical protein [Micromonospora sp. NPDC005367]|uniref:hypothetical protein n=1 Tax=Micromonospora sp. NPDC005367 TaxID=3155590 RepID=UPI0033A07193